MGDVAEDSPARGRDVPVLEPPAVAHAHRRLVDTVLTGGGLPELADVVRDLFDGVVLVTTADGRVLASAGDPEREAEVRASDAFHPSGRFRTEAAAPGVHTVGGLTGSHVVVAVSGGRIDHGRLVVFTDAAPGPEQVAVLERAAEVAAITLTKELAVTSVESKYRGDFLRDVLAGRAGTAEEVVTHGRTLGWDLARPAVVVVAVLETGSGPPARGYQGPLELERFAAAWTTVVAREDPGAPVVGFAAEVVALLPAESAAEGRAVVERVTGAVRGDGGGGRRRFAAGVSRPVSRVVELPAAYEQARRASVAGRRLYGPSAVVHFDDLGVFRLLSLIEDPGELDRFVEETLKELADPASADAATLRETLQVLLDTNLNVAETARELHFHYNTLRYRIGKIERAVGRFTKDPHLRLDLALALRVVALRELG